MDGERHVRTATLRLLVGLMLGVAGLVTTDVVLAKQEIQTGTTAVVAETHGVGLRARSGPGMSYSIVAVLTEGTLVQIISGPVTDGGVDDWYQVSVGGVVMGWVRDRHLDPIAVPIDPTVSSSSLLGR